MSGSRFKSGGGGANHTPLAPRPRALGGGGGGGGSLLNPDYLAGGKKLILGPFWGRPNFLKTIILGSNGSGDNGGSSGFGSMGPPLGMPPGPPPGGAPSFKPPPGIIGASEADESKRSKALETIMKFNAEQARKRAATGDIAETANPPMIGDASAAPGSSGADDAAKAEARAERKRKRKSRWGGGETDKCFIPGMPTMMPKGLNKEQEEAYLCKLSSLT